MRRAQIKETDEGKEVLEDRELVKEYRKAKKKRTKGKATQGLMKLAKARPMCTEVPKAMMCKGEERQEQGNRFAEIDEDPLPFVQVPPGRWDCIASLTFLFRRWAHIESFCKTYTEHKIHI